VVGPVPEHQAAVEPRRAPSDQRGREQSPAGAGTTTLLQSPSIGASSTASFLLSLGRTAGNSAVVQLLAEQASQRPDRRPEPIVQRCGSQTHDGCGCQEEAPTRRSESMGLQRQVPVPAGGGGPGGFDPDCLNLLGQILSLLYGSAVHTVGSETVTGPPIKRGLLERYQQLLEDPRNLYLTNRTRAQADPKYGSYEGHQEAFEGQQRSLRDALEQWRTRCGPPGGGSVPEESRAVIRTANDWSTRPVPERPRRADEAGGQLEQRYTIVLGDRTLAQVTGAEALAALADRTRWDEGKLEQMSGEHALLKQNRDEHNVVGWIVDVAGGVTMPELSIWDESRNHLELLRSALSAQDVNRSVSELIAHETAYGQARRTYLSYKEGMEGGAENVVLGLEVVVVACAVTFVVAGGFALAGVGAGASATAGTAGMATTTTAATTTATTGLTATAVTGATAATTSTAATLVAATDTAAASTALGAAGGASQVVVSAEALEMAKDAMLWTAEEAQFASMAP
jgi:hypothetical protein